MPTSDKKTLTQEQATDKAKAKRKAPAKKAAAKKPAPARSSRATTPKAHAKSAQKRATVAKNPPKRPRGRPTLRGKEVEDEIITRLASGEPLAQICRDEHMPALSTVYDWCDADETFSGRFARARDDGFEMIAVDCLRIADDGTNDFVEKAGRDGQVGVGIDKEHIQRSRLRVDTRLKLLSKWNPKKYGDRVNMDHGVQEESPLGQLLNAIGGQAGSLRPADDGDA